MAAQKGKDLLLKIDSNGAGSFVTVAGLRTKRLAFNSETVDVTDADSTGRWRELLSGSGVQRARPAGGPTSRRRGSLARIWSTGRRVPRILLRRKIRCRRSMAGAWCRRRA
ncbi:phage major tail protein, TP901-1 family [Mesorhizobium sp. CAU 1732]|uniref:phage major tail protein, TP901-1 family n=1 Tax=Mesorhizobium sp. CAU 1732 TaxID=3140358 RepID=UPI0032615C40